MTWQFGPLPWPVQCFGDTTSAEGGQSHKVGSELRSWSSAFALDLIGIRCCLAHRRCAAVRLRRCTSTFRASTRWEAPSWLTGINSLPLLQLRVAHAPTLLCGSSGSWAEVSSKGERSLLLPYAAPMPALVRNPSARIRLVVSC